MRRAGVLRGKCLAYWVLLGCCYGSRIFCTSPPAGADSACKSCGKRVRLTPWD